MNTSEPVASNNVTEQTRGHNSEWWLNEKSSPERKLLSESIKHFIIIINYMLWFFPKNIALKKLNFSIERQNFCFEFFFQLCFNSCPPWTKSKVTSSETMSWFHLLKSHTTWHCAAETVTDCWQETQVQTDYHGTHWKHVDINWKWTKTSVSEAPQYFALSWNDPLHAEEMDEKQPFYDVPLQ